MGFLRTGRVWASWSLVGYLGGVRGTGQNSTFLRIGREEGGQ